MVKGQWSNAAKKQIKARSKTVTRRLGWKHLKVGDKLQGCVKCQGLRSGEKLEKLAAIEVVDIRREPLYDITAEDCAKEAFPEMTPKEFVKMFCEHMDAGFETEVTRIEFKYL